MYGVAQRLARIERLMPRVCGLCSGRVLVIAHPEGEPPPRGSGCACGSQLVLYWASEAPVQLDQELAGDRESERNELLEEAAP